MKNTGMWIVVLLAALTAGSAWADRPDRRDYRDRRDDRSGVRIGISIGTPWPAPSYYPYRSHHPRPYRWPHVVVPAAIGAYAITSIPPVVVTPPPIYVEQAPAPAAVPVLDPGYWYYCNEAGAYYPYVQSCPGDWIKVQPQSR